MNQPNSETIPVEPKRKVNRFVIGTAAIVLIFIALVVVVFRGTQTYYFTVSELAARSDELKGERFRVAGLARQVELIARPLRFMLEWDGKTLPVIYVGLRNPPDTFGEGVETVVTGTLGQTGEFKAEQIQCKCGSKYEAETMRERLGNR